MPQMQLKKKVPSMQNYYATERKEFCLWYGAVTPVHTNSLSHADNKYKLWTHTKKQLRTVNNKQKQVYCGR